MYSCSIDYKMVNQDIIVYSNSGTIRQKVNFYDHVKKMEDSGVGELILTSIDHEGDMNGYDIETLYKYLVRINSDHCIWRSRKIRGF